MVNVAALIFLPIGLLMLGGGVKSIRAGQSSSQRSKQVSETAVSDIESLQPGTVAVEGTARADESEGTVPTALTGEEALVSWSRVVAKKRTGGGENSHTKTETLHKEDQRVPFLVEDATGTVRVDPPEEVDVKLDDNYLSVGRNDHPPDIADLADDPAAAASGPVPVGGSTEYSDWGHEYHQGAIVPGEDVYVLGEAIDRADWDGSDIEITGGENSDRFIVSDLSRKEVQSSNKYGAYLAYAFGGILGFFGLSAVLVSIMTFLS